MRCMVRAGRRSPDFGTPLPVPEAWREVAMLEMQARRLSRSELARRVGVSPTAITHLLDGRYDSSSLVRPVSKILNLALPPAESDDPALVEWWSVGARLRSERPALFDTILATAKASLVR